MKRLWSLITGQAAIDRLREEGELRALYIAVRALADEAKDPRAAIEAAVKAVLNEADLLDNRIPAHPREWAQGHRQAAQHLQHEILPAVARLYPGRSPAP